MTYRRFITGSRDSGFFDAESMGFQERILHKSGLSEETFFPPGAGGVAAAVAGGEASRGHAFGQLAPLGGCPTRRWYCRPASRNSAPHPPSPPRPGQACTWTRPSLT